MSAINHFLSRSLEVGASQKDSRDTKRQKRILLTMHYIAILGSPVVMALSIVYGKPWVALAVFLTNTLPFLINILYFHLRKNLAVAKACYMLFCVATTIIPLMVGGGITQTGYSSYFVVIPMCYLCLTLNPRQALLFELIMILIPLSFTAADSWLSDLIVHRWKMGTSLSATWSLWLWCFNIVASQACYFSACLFLVHDIRYLHNIHVMFVSLTKWNYTLISLLKRLLLSGLNF